VSDAARVAAPLAGAKTVRRPSAHARQRILRCRTRELPEAMVGDLITPANARSADEGTASWISER
jgi:hypothetical protein